VIVLLSSPQQAQVYFIDLPFPAFLFGQRACGLLTTARTRPGRNAFWIVTPMSVCIRCGAKLARHSDRVAGDCVPHPSREFVTMNLAPGDLLSLQTLEGIST